MIIVAGKIVFAVDSMFTLIIEYSPLCGQIQSGLDRQNRHNSFYITLYLYQSYFKLVVHYGDFATRRIHSNV